MASCASGFGRHVVTARCRTHTVGSIGADGTCAHPGSKTAGSALWAPAASDRGAWGQLHLCGEQDPAGCNHHESEGRSSVAGVAVRDRGCDCAFPGSGGGTPCPTHAGAKQCKASGDSRIRPGEIGRAGISGRKAWRKAPLDCGEHPSHYSGGACVCPQSSLPPAD